MTTQRVGRFRHRKGLRSSRVWITRVGFFVGFFLILAISFGPNLVAATEEQKCTTDNQLVVATGSDVSAGSLRRDLIEEWNQKPGTMNAKLVEISTSTDEERAEMAAAAQSQDCTYDVLVLDVAWTAEFAANNYLRPLSLDAAQKAPFLEKVLRTGELNEVQYAMPFATDAPLLFRQEGLPFPHTPEQLMRVTEQYGYVGQHDDYEGGTVNLMEAILSSGAKIMEGDEIVLDTPENARRAKNALMAWHTMLTGKTRANTDLREESSLHAFQTGKVGYMRNWPFAFHRLASDPSMRKGEDLRFTASPIPGTGILGGSNLAITKRSPDFDQAKRLIMFLTTAEAQLKLFACSGYPPVIKSVYDLYRKNPKTCGELLAGGGPTSDGIDPENEITANQLQLLASAIGVAVDKSEPRPPVAHYSMFSDLFRYCARQVVTGASTGDDLDFDLYADALREGLDGRRSLDDPCRRPAK